MASPASTNDGVPLLAGPRILDMADGLGEICGRNLADLLVPGLTAEQTGQFIGAGALEVMPAEAQENRL